MDTKTISVLIIGSNPSQKSPDTSAFHPSTKSRKIIDSWFKDIPVDISFTNVIDRPTEKNRPLTQNEIMSGLPALIDLSKKYDKVVALGSSAGRAVDMGNIGHIKMPHPSGLNRQLNDGEWVRRKVLELTKYLLS
jgi:hypothetical protein